MVAQIDNWLLICPERNMRDAQEFVKCVQDAGRGMGMRIANPQPYVFYFISYRYYYLLKIILFIISFVQHYYSR